MGDGRLLWSRAETVLALDVATRVRGVNMDHPIVVDLSRLLRAAAGPRSARSHRNVHGVGRKVARLALLLAGGSTTGGARLEREVCDEFAGRPEALALAADEARRSLAAPFPLCPSRGPVPAFGEVAALRMDGPTFVYLAGLAGARLDDGRSLAKVGRSADVARRMEELNEGLPVPLGMRWRAIAAWRYPDAAAAHAAEQGMLARCGAAGCSAGGEFLAVDADGLAAIARSGPDLTARSGRRRAPTGPFRLASRAGRTPRRAPRGG